MSDPEVKDAAAESSPATQEPTDDFALPTEVKDDKSRERFQKLVDRAKQAEAKLSGYEQFGDPEQLSQFVQYTQQLEGQLESMQAQIKRLDDKRETGDPKTKEQKELEANASEVRKQLRSVEPTIEKVEKFMERQEVLSKQDAEAVLEDARAETQSIMAEAKMATDPASVNRFGRILEAIITETPKLAVRFKRNPEKVVRMAYDIFRKEHLGPLENSVRTDSQRQKEKVTTLPRAHGGGGGPGNQKTQDPAKNIGDGISRALGKWRERGA